MTLVKKPLPLLDLDFALPFPEDETPSPEPFLDVADFSGDKDFLLPLLTCPVTSLFGLLRLEPVPSLRGDRDEGRDGETDASLLPAFRLPGDLLLRAVPGGDCPDMLDLLGGRSNWGNVIDMEIHI